AVQRRVRDGARDVDLDLVATVTTVTSPGARTGTLAPPPHVVRRGHVVRAVPCRARRERRRASGA
ncbi:hypothetical protein, partial [Streptomyces sp. NPDC054838]